MTAAALRCSTRTASCVHTQVTALPAGGHRTRPGLVGHVDDQRGGFADVDVHLGAVAEEDDLGYHAADRVVRLPDRIVGGLQGDAFRPDDDGRRPGSAESSTAAPSRVSSAEHTADPLSVSSTSASKMFAAPRNPATYVVAGAE